VDREDHAPTDARRWAVEKSMKNDLSSEIERFAEWFNQDFGILFSSIEEGSQEYFRTLTLNQKASLKKDLKKLIDEFPGNSKKGILNAWIRLGAQWWDKKQDLRTEIHRWIRTLT
jgi:hypothetical protein